jgi:hypothetical protein
MSALRTGLAQLRVPWRGAVATIAPLTAIIGTLLALGLIHPFGGDALAAGASHTSDAGTAHVNLSYNGKGQTFTSQGDFDYRAHRGLMHYDFSNTPGAENLDDVPIVFWGSHAYERIGQAWVRFDPRTADKLLADAAAALGKPAPTGSVAALGQLQLNDPSQVLKYLETSHDAKKVGEGQEFGTQTTEYRATIPVGKEQVVVTAWVGDDKYIHRLDASGQDWTMTTRLSRFGEPVKVDRPPADQVKELSDLLT